MNDIGFGVIGCGSIAKKAFIPALIQSDVAELIGVASRSLENVKSVSKNYDCRGFEKVSQLLSSEDINAVYIATPPSTHEELILSAARNGKHIICEKPLSTSLNSVERIINICKKNKIALLEGFMYQFHPQHEFVYEYINNNQMGDPILFEAQFGFPSMDKNNFRYSKELGGGILFDAGVYTIHAARKFFKREPINLFSIINFEKLNVDLSGSILMDFGQNQMAQLSFGFNNYYQNYYSIWCSKGKVKLNRAFSIPSNLQPEVIIEHNNSVDKKLLDPCNQFLNEINCFVSGLKSERLKEKWFQDSLNQVKILQEILDRYYN